MAAIGGLLIALGLLMILFIPLFAQGMMNPDTPGDERWGAYFSTIGSGGGWGVIGIGALLVGLGVWLIVWTEKDYRKLMESMARASNKPQPSSEL